MAISESEREMIRSSLRYLQETSDDYTRRVSADGRVESDSGHFNEPAAGGPAKITPEQIELEIRARLALLVALNIKAQERLTGVAHDDARRDMLRAETDALVYLRTLTLGAAHAVDDTDSTAEGESAR